MSQGITHILRNWLVQGLLTWSCAIKALIRCVQELFPNLHILLRILSTIPVTTSTPERTFSVVKRLKTHLSSTMRQDRLTGLAHLHIHREFTLTPEEVMDQFAKENRRIVL